MRQADVPELLKGSVSRYQPSHYRRELYDNVFLGEFPDHPVITDLLAQRGDNDGWSTESEVPAPVLHTVEKYQWDGSGYDCSLTSSVSVTLPSVALLRLLAPNARPVDGTVRNADGTVVAFAPDTIEPAKTSLLVHADLLHTALTTHGLALGRLLFQERRSGHAHRLTPSPGMITRTSLHIHTPDETGWTNTGSLHHDGD